MSSPIFCNKVCFSQAFLPRISSSFSRSVDQRSGQELLLQASQRHMYEHVRRASDPAPGREDHRETAGVVVWRFHDFRRSERTTNLRGTCGNVES